jgi:hypothetical protein
VSAQGEAPYAESSLVLIELGQGDSLKSTRSGTLRRAGVLASAGFKLGPALGGLRTETLCFSSE